MTKPLRPARMRYKTRESYDNAMKEYHKELEKEEGAYRLAKMQHQSKVLKEQSKALKKDKDKHTETNSHKPKNRRPIKSSFSTGDKTFITYATDWDIHSGSRKWNELSVEEQNQFLDEQFKSSGKTQWDQAIQSDMLKSHALAFRTLIVDVFISLKDADLIRANDITDNDVVFALSESLDEITMGKRIKEYFDRTDNVTFIPDEDFIFLTSIDSTEAPFDDFYRLKDFLKENLSNCAPFADSPLSFFDHAKLIADRIEEMHQSRSIEGEGPKRTKVMNKKKTSVFSIIYNSIFTPPEVKLTINEINKTLDDRRRNMPSMLFSDGLLRKINRQASSYAKKNDETISAISEENVRPRDLAMVYIVRVTSKYLTSGHYHFYRGRLTEEGNYLYKVTQYFLSELKKSGHSSVAEVRNFEAEILQGIQNAG